MEEQVHYYFTVRHVLEVKIQKQEVELQEQKKDIQELEVYKLLEKKLKI